MQNVHYNCKLAYMLVVCLLLLSGTAKYRGKTEMRVKQSYPEKCINNICVSCDIVTEGANYSFCASLSRDAMQSAVMPCQIVCPPVTFKYRDYI